MPKSVTILIDQDDLETLKKNQYRLCFAKKVNDTYNVVWQSYDAYVHSNNFTWVPVYQLFGSNVFDEEVTVQVTTNSQNVMLGERCTLDAAGWLGPASSGGPSLSVTLFNNFGSIHPGLNSVSTGPDGVQATTPIYVAEKAIVSGSVKITPIETIQVWFQQDIATSTVLSDAVSNAVEIDLTEDDDATRLYSKGAWTTPASEDVAVDDPHVYLTILITGTAVITAAAIAKQLSTYLTGVYQSLTVQVDPVKNGFKIAYSEKKRMSASEARFLSTVMSSPSSVDDLTQKTLQGLTVLKSEFATFDVTAG